MYLLETNGKSPVGKYNSRKHPLICFAFLLTLTAMLGYYHRNPGGKKVSSEPSTPGNTISNAAIGSDTAQKDKFAGPKKISSGIVAKPYNDSTDTTKLTRQSRVDNAGYLNRNKPDSTERLKQSGEN